MCEQLPSVCGQALLVLLMGSLTLLSVVEPTVTSSETTAESNSTPAVTDALKMYAVSDGLTESEKRLIRLNEMNSRLKLTECSNKNSSETIRQNEKVFVIFTKVKRNWFEAYEDCLQNNMSFASIESEEEYNRILEQLKAVGDKMSEFCFWLSGTDLGQAGTYVWTSTGRRVTINKWHFSRLGPVYEPTNSYCADGGREDCVQICPWWENDTINDYCCSLRQYYVCQH